VSTNAAAKSSQTSQWGRMLAITSGAMSPARVYELALRGATVFNTEKTYTSFAAFSGAPDLSGLYQGGDGSRSAKLG
jgi:hypothetical protein